MGIVDTELDRKIDKIFSDIRGELRITATKIPGEYAFKCVDCGTEHRLHIVHLTHPCKPRCTVCGSTFLEPMTTRGRTAVAYRSDAYNGDGE